MSPFISWKEQKAIDVLLALVKNVHLGPTLAVLGTADFEVLTIDPASIRLAGVAPILCSHEDVATLPVYEYEFTTEGSDGHMDLILKFDTHEIVAALGAVYDGDCFELTPTGVDFSDTPIEGTDFIEIIAKGKM